MDNVRQRSWFSITAYVMISLSVLSLILFFAETFFPNQSTSLVPRQGDRISRWLFDSSRWQNPQNTYVGGVAPQEKLFMLINQKQSAGKAELVYRGLLGHSEFQIDVIVPELDPQASYPYRFAISQAKKSFRLAGRNYRLISAKKGALQLRVINPQ